MKTEHNEKIAEQILSMARCGIPQTDMAKVVGISVNSMKKYYGQELDSGHTLANLAVGNRLFEKCMEGDTACLIFWAKTRMGWREKSGSAKQSEILTQFKNGNLSLKEAALEFEINSIPLPDTIRILLAKEQPEPVDPTGGQYRIMTDEEMEALVAQREAQIKEETEKWLPQRRAEIRELYKEVEDKWSPDMLPDSAK